MITHPSTTLEKTNEIAFSIRKTKDDTTEAKEYNFSFPESFNCRPILLAGSNRKVTVSELGEKEGTIRVKQKQENQEQKDLKLNYSGTCTRRGGTSIQEELPVFILPLLGKFYLIEDR